jgi:hypothetical protein
MQPLISATCLNAKKIKIKIKNSQKSIFETFFRSKIYMPDASQPELLLKNWCCYYSKPQFFPETNNMSNPRQKREKSTLKLEFLTFNFKKWRTKICMQ